VGVVIVGVLVIALIGCVIGLVMMLNKISSEQEDRANSTVETSAPADEEDPGETEEPENTETGEEESGGIAYPVSPENDPDGDGVITAPSKLPGMEQLEPDRFSDSYCEAWDAIPSLGDAPTQESVTARIDGLRVAQAEAYPDAVPYFDILIDYLTRIHTFLGGDESQRDALIADSEYFRSATLILVDSSVAACMF
jgi:hypothetical protein